MIEIGAYVKDIYSGYTGHVTGRCEYLDRAPLCLVVSDRLEGGAPKEEWIPERRLVPTEKHRDLTKER